MLARLFTMVFLGALVWQLPSHARLICRNDNAARATEPTGVNRALANHIMQDSNVLFEGARLVPSLHNGAVQGFKVYAIRPGSLPDVLGFETGDTFHAAADEQSHLRFDITRSGTTTSLLVPISES